MRPAGLFAVAVCLMVFSLRAEGANVRKEHPRIFFTDEVVAQMKKNIAEVPLVAEAYGKLKDWADGGTLDEPSWTIQDRAAAVALCYLVENKPPALLAKLKAGLETLPIQRTEPAGEGRPARTIGTDDWTSGLTAWAMSMCYDAAYNELTPEERATYAKAIVTVADRVFTYYRHSDYNNHVYIQYGPVVFAGLALANDGYEAEQAKKYLDWGEDFLKNHGAKAFAQVGGEDGGWHESRSYHALFVHWFVHQLYGWKTATGEDLFPQATGLRGDAQWMVHTNQPHDGERVGVADIGTKPNEQRTPGWDETFYYLPILAREYRDGVAQYGGMRGFDDYAFRNWAFIVGYDPTVKPVPPEEMPTAQIFENLGWAAMRSDWTKEATYALFMCGRYFAGHEHMDKNSFIIQKQGTLAIDAGEYGAKATECHNTILIGGNQRPFGTDPIQFVEPIEPGHPCYTGHLVAYEADKDYTYVCGDATPAYEAAKVKQFIRQFVYLRPDLFVVYDRTESVGPQERRWMLHSLEPAELNGGEVVISNLDGKLWVKMLSPEGVTSSQYQMVAKKDEPGYSQQNANRKDNYIAIVPKAPADRQDFLTVLYAMGSTEAPQDAEGVRAVGRGEPKRLPGPPKVTSCERVEKDGKPGARVVVGDTTYQVLFATDGAPAGHVTITGPGRSVDKDLAAKVVR